MARQAAREPIATWWRIRSYATEIESIPVLAFTDKTVTFWNGYREERNAQMSDFYSYFPTWEQARDRLLSRLEQKLHNAKCGVLDLESKVEKVKKLTPQPAPEGATRKEK